jgi:hypothetical protein
VDVLQVWVLIGVPALVLALALFARRSPLRALVGYVVLGGAFAGVTAVDRASGAVFGGLLTLLYAAGRGGRLEHEGEPLTGVDAVPEVTRRVARDHAGAES